MSLHSPAYRIHVGQAKKLAEKLAKSARGSEILALVGPLGSGKTTFAKHFGKALGVKNAIASPTFVIMQEHPVELKRKDRRPLFFYHLDMYRAFSPEDVAALGLEQIWGRPDTVTVIEWADKIKNLLPAQTTFIYFQDK